MASTIVPISLSAPGFYGLNSQDSPTDMDPKFALDATNCVIDRSGRVASRKGWAAQHTTLAALGASDVDALGELIDPAGASTIIAAGNNKIFKFTGTTLVELTYGGGGIAPTITASNWQMCSLGTAIVLFQIGHDPLIYDATISTSAYRRLSEHATYSGTVPLADCAISAYGRVWAARTTANKVTVSWSDTSTFQKWTGGTAGSLDLTSVWPAGGDEVVALAAHNNSLIIFGRRQTLIYTGAITPSTMTLGDTITGIGCVLPRPVLTLCNLARAAAGGDVEARAKALELEAAFAVLSSFDEGPDLVLYFKYLLELQGEAEYALHFNETDALSPSQRGYAAAQFKLFTTWYADWSQQGGAVARYLA